MRWAILPDRPRGSWSGQCDKFRAMLSFRKKLYINCQFSLENIAGSPRMMFDSVGGGGGVVGMGIGIGMHCLDRVGSLSSMF